MEGLVDLFHALSFTCNMASMHVDRRKFACKAACKKNRAISDCSQRMRDLNVVRVLPELLWFRSWSWTWTWYWIVSVFWFWLLIALLNNSKLSGKRQSILLSTLSACCYGYQHCYGLVVALSESLALWQRIILRLQRIILRLQIVMNKNFNEFLIAVVFYFHVTANKEFSYAKEWVACNNISDWDHSTDLINL